MFLLFSLVNHSPIFLRFSLLFVFLIYLLFALLLSLPSLYLTLGFTVWPSIIRYFFSILISSLSFVLSPRVLPLLYPRSVSLVTVFYLYLFSLNFVFSNSILSCCLSTISQISLLAPSVLTISICAYPPIFVSFLCLFHFSLLSHHIHFVSLPLL